MSKIALSPSPTGSAVYTIASPAGSTDRTLTLPDVTGGEFIVSNASGNVGIGTNSPVVNGVGQRLLTETTNGLISIGPTGHRDTARATVLIRTKTDNPAEVDFQNTISGANYGWQISSRTGTTPNLEFYANNNGAFTERIRIDGAGNFAFNSGFGSTAIAYGCRAWVNFNGTGTVAIRASGNVSSITDEGIGRYTVNFTTAMPDANYSVTTGCDTGSRVAEVRNYTTTSVGLTIHHPAIGVVDISAVNIAIHR